MAKRSGSLAKTKNAPPYNQKATKLEGNLGIREADAVRRALAQAIGAGSACIDVRGLSAVDTSIVQLLIAATRSAAERGARLEIAGFEEGALAAFMRSVGVSAEEINVVS